MDRFLREYKGHTFDDWGSSCSDDYKSFARKFKGYLKRNLPNDVELIDFSANHYDHSGFVKRENVYIYISWSWDRYSPVDIDVTGAHRGVLVRYAKDRRDFRGEINRFCSLKELPEFVNEMFERRN